MATTRQAALINEISAASMPTYERVVRAEEIAKLLDCSVKTVLRKAKAGEIPAVQIGKLWRFRRSAVSAWFDAQQQRAGTYLAGKVDCTGHPRVPHHEGKN